MIKMFIQIRKVLWTKPKWRILRIYTKTISRSKIELLKRTIELEIEKSDDPNTILFLEGKLVIINLLLK